MSRREFTAAVKLAAWERCKGPDGRPRCECCGGLIVGRPEYDHDTPDGLGGEPTLENCKVLSAQCHRIKTHEHDRLIMTKADAQRKSTAGIRPKSRHTIRSRGFVKRDQQFDPTPDT